MHTYQLDKPDNLVALLEESVAKHPNNPVLRLYDVKIAPEISPKKNIGSALLALIAVMLVSLAYRPLMPDFPRGSMSVGVALVCWG